MTKKNNKCIEVEIDGMTCSSCEILLERKLKKVKGVSKVDVNYTKGTAKINYTKNKPQLSQLKSIVEKAGYSFANDPNKKEIVSRKRHFMEFGGVLIIVLGLFLLFGNFEMFSNVGVSENMSFGFILFIGLVAAFSSCLAVTGGLLVSVTAKYAQMHPNLTGIQKFKPHIYFNTGRIVGYTILGALIGFFGSLISISTTVTGIITILASVIMILLGLQLLEISPKFFGKFKPRLPKSISHKIMQKSEETRKSTPFFLGAATFFLPCGFTYALQLYVLSKADPMIGAITMFAFSLGTLPGLLSLGVLSSFLKGTSKRIFFKTAGITVIILGILTIPNGLVLAGINTIDSTQQINDEELISKMPKVENNSNFDNPNVRIENGVQIVEMQVKGFDYYPHQFTIYKDMPVEWRIDGSKARGCAKVITIPKLKITKYLTGGVDIIEFTPDEIGNLEFMCTMAMTTRGAMFKVIEK
ncbi:MAG: sulfite exporter TauE/SafE family protein [Nanoarchaeota archaeon]|nr:sulfite exporter TauE/SafE family protein [Nanoarchaeota archaeon]